MLLKDRVALVTGGGTGIGRAIATRLAEQGARVVIASRNLDMLTETARALSAGGHDVWPVRLDITRPDEIDQAVAAVKRRGGRIDILVNNAGLSGMNPMDRPNDSLWDAVLAVNLTGMYRLTRRVLPEMPDHAGGRVINISSVLGKFGVPGYTAYCTAKHGVVGFTRALAAEVAPRGITVNAICPGWVDTQMAHDGVRQIAADLGVTPEAFKKQALEKVPLGRFLDPLEIGDLAVYLASDAARGMTGQAINLCGGATTA